MNGTDAAKTTSSGTGKLELKHLERFVMLAQELHFSRAADRLDISQSPLSRVIQRLERIVQRRLFDRSNQGTQLTVAGQVLLRRSVPILDAVAQALRDVLAATSAAPDRLRIGISVPAATPKLAALLARHRAEKPDVSLHLMELPSSDHLRALRAEEIDVAFAIEGGPTPSIKTQAVWTDTLVLVVPAQHAFTELDEIPFGTAMAEPLIVHDLENTESFRARIDRMIHAANPNPDIRARVSSLASLLTCVRAGMGIGLSTAGQTVVGKRVDIVTRPLQPMVSLAIYLLYRDEPLAGLLSQFLEWVKLVTSG